MNKYIKNIITICLSLVLILSTCMVSASADDPVVTYGVEYGDNSATVTVYLSVIDAFDIAIAYDPDKLTVSDCGFTMDFKKLQIGGENTTISVFNEDAKDDSGNTYAIFTGAGANMTTEGPIDFEGKPLCTVTFEGEMTGTEITIVTDSAQEKNVYEANLIGRVALDNSVKAEITPKPIENATNGDSGSSDDASVNNEASSATDAPKADEGSDNTNVSETASPEETATATETVSATEMADSEGDKDNSVPTEEADGQEDAVSDEEEEKAEEDDADIKDDGAGVKPIVIVAVLAAVAVVVAVVIVVKKKKK